VPADAEEGRVDERRAGRIDLDDERLVHEEVGPNRIERGKVGRLGLADDVHVPQRVDGDVPRKVVVVAAEVSRIQE
jgi:hypothetical protein